MQRFYGLDLVDFYRGSLSARKAMVLLENLPPGAALYRELDSPAAWTEEAHLAAMQEHSLRVLAWQKTKWGAQGIKSPKPLPRPGVDTGNDGTEKFGGEAVSIEEMDEWLASIGQP